MCREEANARCLIRTDAAGAVVNLRFKPTAASILSPAKNSRIRFQALSRFPTAPNEKKSGTICFRRRQIERRGGGGRTSGTKEILFYTERIHTYEITIGTPPVRTVLAEKGERERSVNNEIYEI